MRERLSEPHPAALEFFNAVCVSIPITSASISPAL